MIKKILAIYISSFLIFQPVVFADEKVVTVQEGDPAPFSGTLFNTEAAARLLIDLEFTQEQCQIETQAELTRQGAELQLKIDTLQASVDGCNQRYTDVLQIKNDQIDFLDDQLKNASRNNEPLWLVIGVVSGVLITAAAGWTMGQINSSAPN